MKRRLRALVRRAGFDVVRYPVYRPDYSLETLLRAVFARRGITHVIDVGAGDGEYGAWLRTIGYDGAIVSFEARGSDVLTERIGADGRWDLHPVVLGPSPGPGVARLDDRLDTVVPPSARVMLKVESPVDVLRGAERSLARIVAVQTRGPADGLERAIWLRERGFSLAGMFPVPSDDGDPLVLRACDQLCLRGEVP